MSEDDERPTFSYQVPYWRPFVAGIGAAATGGLVFVAIEPGITVLSGLIAGALVGFWRGVGWSQFYRVSIRGEVIEFRAIFRKVVAQTADVVEVVSGRRRSWWRARSGGRFFALAMRNGRRLDMMAAKGLREFIEALGEVVPGLAECDIVWSPRFEKAFGRSGFVRVT